MYLEDPDEWGPVRSKAIACRTPGRWPTEGARGFGLLKGL